MTSSMPVVRTSDPSISTIRVRRRSIKPILIASAIAIVLLIVVGAIILEIITTAKEARQEAEALAEEARRPKRINAVAFVENPIPPVPSIQEESSHVDFSLFSSPSDARVYRQNEWIGNTPIEQVKLERSSEQEEWLIVLDGYEIIKFNMPLEQSYSKVFTLEKELIAATPSPTPSDGDGLQGVKPVKRRSSKQSKTAGFDSSIALPD